MRNTQVTVKKRTPSTPREVKKESDIAPVSKSAIVTVACLTGLIGIWGAICLFSGFLSSSGIGSLFSSWFDAIIGIK